MERQAVDGMADGDSVPLVVGLGPRSAMIDRCRTLPQPCATATDDRVCCPPIDTLAVGHQVSAVVAQGASVAALTSALVGSHTLTCVPWPGCECSCKLPPSASTLKRMPSRP